MRGGNLQQFDTPAEIYQRPANVFVADFIGTPSMTLLDADLHRRNGSAEVRIGGTTIALPDRHVAPARANIAPIKLGIRPEDVVLDEVGFPAEVKVVEPTGHECIVLFALHGTTVKARVPAHVRLDMGQSAKISFRTSKLHIFDRATGLRMS
jgi:multiple sugar transport system ATP-binding protein